VIVFAKDFETHLERLEQVFCRFKDANLKLKPSKCNFLMEKVGYLGFLISKEGLQPDPAKVRAIAEMAVPVDKDETKRFLGMMSY
jgi:hypothetical protein